MRNENLYQYLILFNLLVGIFLFGCQNHEQSDYLFRQITSENSGIHFSNNVIETKDFNILNFHYIYNGGGVGVGDFDKNGFPDLIFTGNQVSSKIYLNQGNLRFEDVSDETNFHTQSWTTGVSIIDINGDGWEDIYLAVGGNNCDGDCKNQLFIHQGLDKNGLPQFEEKAKAFGLSDENYTQQAAFFDYDQDGDLDVYLLHNVTDKRDKNAPSEKRFINKKSIDQLYENQGNGIFEDVSVETGIIHRGYGLGVTINDFNQDGWPDIYIANDFLSDDLMYLNLGIENGKHLGFEESGQKYLKHTSYNAMGVDVADINNDALPDIFVLDMLPEYNERQKSMMGFMNYNKFLLTLRQGYAPQFVRNTLQLHNGFLNNQLLPFSEIAYLSGIYHTDWSWTPLLADFDNDGDKDLFVTNGYGKDITDLDFINYSQTRNPFGTKVSQEQELYEKIKEMESVTMPNYIFENQGKFSFKNQQDSWLRKENSISNGAVYADLDNDGDLDLVVNNLNQAAFLLENQTNHKSENNFLKIKLIGTTNNDCGIGSKVELWSDGVSQLQYQSPVRGYLSTVSNILHFGLGKSQKVDSIKVTWWNNSTQIFRNIPANQLIELAYNPRPVSAIRKSVHSEKPTVFQESPMLSKLIHQENIYQDFNVQALLLQQHSRQGPCLAVANIDGKKGDELFLGGAKGYPSQIIFLEENGNFRTQLIKDSEKYEDTDATFFDYDQDGDPDLYVVSGGSENLPGSPEYSDRLYLNDGTGNFTLQEIRLPTASGSCVRPHDFDQDGKVELFIGGRLVPQKYPHIPQSSLLVHHPFSPTLLDYANKLAHPLERIGMVTDANWSDIDRNEWDDLVIVGEWMPITIFKNRHGHFHKKDTIQIPNSNGMWNCIAKGDFDQDGDEDFLLGNLGQNSKLKAFPNQPVVLFQDDLDKNGSPDPFIGQYYSNKKGETKLYPFHARDDVMRQVPPIKNRFGKYSDFGKATFQDLLGQDGTDRELLTLNCLSSSYLENKGNDTFELSPLPLEAQMAPVQSILVADFDKDGHLDALLIGNDFTSEKNNGWQDAFNGLYLKGDGKGHFQAISSSESGFLAMGDGRDLVLLKDKNDKEWIVAGQNNGALQCFEF